LQSALTKCRTLKSTLIRIAAECGRQTVIYQRLSLKLTLEDDNRQSLPRQPSPDGGCPERAVVRRREAGLGCDGIGREGTVARLGFRRRLPVAGEGRWLAGTSVRSRNRACHCRRRSEPVAAGRRRVATSASAVSCSFGGSPESWPPFGDRGANPQARAVPLGIVDQPGALAGQILIQRVRHCLHRTRGSAFNGRARELDRQRLLPAAPP